MGYERALVTGGWGLLGQHLIVRLLDAYPGLHVRVLDLRPHPYPVHDLESLGRVEIVEGDITDASTLQGKFEGHDLVIHLAGYISFWSGERDHLFEVNQGGTRNVVQAASTQGANMFLHASSVAAVGFNNDPDQPVDETFECPWECYPDKHYMQSKHLSETEVAKHAGGMRWIIACPGLMLGPGDLNNSIALINAIRLKKMPVNMPGGTNVIDVRDVAEGVMVLLEKGMEGERYLLSGHNLTFREINSIVP
jgi:dihydroflavonol-4-reductase